MVETGLFIKLQRNNNLAIGVLPLILSASKFELISISTGVFFKVG